jgi:hypothetical protein
MVTQELKHLIELVQSDARLTLLEISNEPEAYTNPSGKFHLSQSRLLPQILNYAA